MIPKVAIIILNWNGWRDTVECLESLYRITYPNYDVIVVDNGSKDDSVQKIKKYCEGKIKVESNFFEYNSCNKPIYVLEYTRNQAEKGGDLRRERYFSKLPSNKKMRLILNEKNYGFAEGNNIAMRYALKTLNPDYILLLNNDTVVDKEFLTELINVAEKDERIGVIGPKIYYYSSPDVIQFVGKKISPWTADFDIKYYLTYPWLKAYEEKRNTEREIRYMMGACMLVRRKAIERVGLLDPEYFAYWEEADWCYRMTRAGYKIVHASKPKIWHKGGATSGAFGVYLCTRNRFLFIRKNTSSRIQLFFFLIFFFIIHFPFLLSLTLIRSICSKNFENIVSMCKGIVDGLKLLKGRK